MPDLVINIIGYPASGKSRVCEYMLQAGFEVFRPSEVLRAFAKETGTTLTGRQDYVNLHRQLNERDPYAIIEPVLSSSQKQLCIDGLRCPVLLDKLQADITQVVTIALDCPLEIRYQRVQQDDARKGTHRAPTSLEAFQNDEQPDYTNPDRNLPNMQEMMFRADFTINANQAPAAVIKDLQKVLGQVATPQA